MRHLSTKEVNSAIFRPRKDNEEVVEKAKIKVVYTLVGQEDELVDENGNEDSKGYPSLWDLELKNKEIQPAETLDNAFAKTAYIRGRQRFYIKQNKEGQFLNPVNGMEDEIRNKKSKIRYTGNESYIFKEVGYAAFMLYLKFLKTKNTAYLTQAEREML